MSNLKNTSDLTWSYPSPAADGTTGGFVWMDTAPATVEDQQEWADYVGLTTDSDADVRNMAWDTDSFVGLYDYNWTSNFYSKATGGSKPGGAGSSTYQTQKVGEGVKFSTKSMWYFDINGDMHKGTPGHVGEHHTIYSPSGDADNYVGPAEGSEAAELLGSGTYDFDNDLGYYIIVK